MQYSVKKTGDSLEYISEMVKHFQKRVGFSKVASKLGCKRYEWRTGMPFGGEEKVSAHWSETSKHVCNP